MKMTRAINRAANIQETWRPIERFRLTETLEPGKSAEATPLYWDAKEKKFVDVSARKRVIWDLYDETDSGEAFGVNFGLKDEIFQAQFRQDTLRLEIVGSKGLHRPAKTDAKISAGGSGKVTIWSNGAATTAKVTAHHLWMHDNKPINADKEVVVNYLSDWRKWIIWPYSCPT